MQPTTLSQIVRTVQSWGTWKKLRGGGGKTKQKTGESI